MARSKLQAVESSAPLQSFQDIVMYKGVHALCTIDAKKQTLKATHIAMCLLHGKEPMWGVWAIVGDGLRFLRFAGTRDQIEKAYPGLTWRRKMSPFQLNSFEDLSIEKRRALITEKYGQ